MAIAVVSFISANIRPDGLLRIPRKVKYCVASDCSRRSHGPTKVKPYNAARHLTCAFVKTYLYLGTISSCYI